MPVQYNFKIEEELKEALEQALSKSDVSNKSDFLAQMLSAYTAHQASNTPTDIDMTKYENVNQQAKDSVHVAFKHILTLLDANFSTTKQETIQINHAHKAFEAKEHDYQSELEKLKSDTTAEINAIKIEADKKVNEIKILLESMSQENQKLQISNTDLKSKLNTSNQLATQVQFITEENQRLRENTKILEDNAKNQEIKTQKSIKVFEKQLSDAKETSLHQEFELKSKAKEYKSVEKQLIEEKENTKLNAITQKEELKVLNQKFSLSEASLNQAIGKLDLLDTQKPI